MKTTRQVKETTGEPIIFPCLMMGAGNDIIVLVSGKNDTMYAGTVIYSNAAIYKVGYYSVSWSDSLSVFEGSVTLSND